ncbi:hypothetical protein DPEC_G00016660 [Dallia pectoralis]|uniref:Uncharacterized protein n=1 Tax=Dallia pectoralis TaxID=75939 RepID=A0ACC2HMQ9_DALPE|nr:hypothetical protein DPEC_G00016660 [Dallia pectoralis]
MRSLLLALLLIGVQAVLNMGGALGQVAANHSSDDHTAANHRAEQSASLTDSPQHQPAAGRETPQRPGQEVRQAHRTASQPQDRNSSLGHWKTESPSTDSIPEVDPKLFSKRRFRSSPRVVFSEVRPTHHALGGARREEEGVRGGGMRVRRKAGVQHSNRGEFPVCLSKNIWVNLTKATDMAGNEVDILPEVKINNHKMKQYFYETICDTDTAQVGGIRGGGAVRGGVGGVKAGKAKSGCRGIDSRHWNSYCTNSHIFVRALTKFKELTSWRLIRINAACECVISRKSYKN